MVQNFGELASHRLYVLTLFRHTLRNANRYCYSVHLRNRIHKVVKTVIWKHRFDKSSWTVYSLLKKLLFLNEQLTHGDVWAVWPMLTQFSKKKKPFHGSELATIVKQLKTDNPVSALRNIEEERQRHILARYINHQQGNNRLPHNIPEEYKVKLLLPMAMHEDAMLRLLKIQHQLNKGVPKVFLTHTSAGSSRIWFVRSALNKSRVQSKALGVLLRAEKKKSQKRLDALERCRQNAVWALEEAIWEQALEGDICSHRDVSRHLSELQNSVVERSHQTDSDIEPTKLQMWLNPIKEVMNMLTNQQQEKMRFFRNYKDEVLVNGGRFKMWERKSHLMHDRRVKRFKQLVKSELERVSPFLSGHDLPSLLNKYKF